MDDPQVYLEKLTVFSRILREKGLAVSPQETADACDILIRLGLSEREQMKAALGTIFAKSRQEQNIFSEAFDGFFVTKEEHQRRLEEAAAQEQARREAQQELEGSNVPLTEEQREAYGELPREERQRLQDFMEKYRGSAARNPQLYGGFIRSVFAKALLEQQMRMEDAGLGCQAQDPELGILYRDVSQFSDTEIPKAISLLQTVTQKINAELTAKKRGGTTGALDFRRTIRHGLATGGSLYHLHYKQKRKRRKSLVVLCDVSSSMVQFSEFALRLIQSLSRVSDNSRVFLFSEALFEADKNHLQNMDLFRNYVRESGLYGRGTDLGTALEQLVRHRPMVLGSSVTLLILSDTKTIDLPRALEALTAAKAQAGRVLWMNPIPESKWHYVRSIGAVSAICPMVSCNTLAALTAACKRLAME